MTTDPPVTSVDVHSLRTFSRLAHSGAECAADSLSQMTGIATYVDVTRVELSTGANVRREFRESDRMSVCIGFDGGLRGQTVVAFDRESADRIASTILPDAPPDDEAAASGIKELGNIMIGGFIDGWADYLDTCIDISTPTYVSDTDDAADAFSGADDDGDESMLVFRNRLQAADNAVNFTLYMIPTASSTGRIVAESGGNDGELPLDSLAEFDAMIADGAAQASEDITTMTGIETTVEVSRLSFVPLEDVPMQIADEPRTGVVLEFDGLPSGYIAILFDEASANRVTAGLLPGMGNDASDEMRRSAIQEIGNIVTSGFLDGWANALETTIDISPPEFVHDLGRSVVAPLASELAQRQEHAFLIDSTIRTDGDEFTCDIYALPDEAELRQSLNRLAATS